MARIVLSGALDHYNAESLKQQLLAAMTEPEKGHPQLILDMQDVEHIDAAALQVLLACQAGLQPEKLAVQGADPSIRQWIRISGAEAFFDFLEMNN